MVQGQPATATGARLSDSSLFLEDEAHRASASLSVQGWCGVLLAGLLHGASIAWPWGVADAVWVASPQSDWTLASLLTWLLLPQAGQPWPLAQLLALSVAVGAVYRVNHPLKAAGVGWLFATASLVMTFWWLFISMHTYGGLAAPLAVVAVLILALLLGLYTALAFWCFKHAARAHVLPDTLVFACLWLLTEWARGVMFTGFPWGIIGYAHVDSLAWAAPWVGVYGMGALAAWAAALLGGLSRPWADHSSTYSHSHVRVHWGRLGLTGAMLCLVLLTGRVVDAGADAHTPAHGTPLPLVLLQGHIAQDEKFKANSGLPRALTWYGQRLAGAVEGGALLPRSMIVAPETALPVLPQQLGREFWSPLLQGIQTHHHAVLLGLPLGSAMQGYANAAWGITPDMAQTALTPWAEDESTASLPFHRYDKHHLVPFGEFIPPLFRWFVRLMHIPLGDFNRGDLGQAPLQWHEQRIAPHICYEDLFGEELAYGWWRDPSQAPTILVNLSNLGWFGNTVALDQHLHISRLRAKELGRPVVRATNTGATVIINAQGQVTHALPRMTAGELHGRVQGHSGLTPYALWVGRWGLWPWVLLSVGLLILVLWRSRPKA